MRRKILISLLSIFLIGVYGLVYGEVEVKKATISFLKGTVKVQKKDEKTFSIAKLGMVVTEGDRIETAEGARVELKLETGSIVRIGENTSIVLEELKEDKDAMKETSNVKVLFGRIWMNVKKSFGKNKKVRLLLQKLLLLLRERHIGQM